MFRWSRSFVTLLAVPAILLARTAFVPGFSQSSRDTSRSTWTVARTAAGHPDFQGVWTNYDPTPFERLNADERRPQGPAVSTADWLVPDSPVSPRRPSMVVDPPDGKVPLRREAVEKRDHDAALPEDSLEHYGPWERCITRGVPGSLFPGAYNNGHQIVQTADHFVIHSEMIHEARVIPLDGRPHLDPSIRSWEGDSRGHWEGDTLVVDTTNFNGKSWIATNVAAGWIRGIPQSQACHLVERLTRVDAATIQYTVTIEDPNVYTRPWTVAFPLNRDDRYRLFEYACHEGNYALGNMLSMGAAKHPR
ncbi:MAG TPA: hypothetical protein VKE51_18350 [Vicinamibacterales bacterium]|nr:hypothetical protein [Vicinamibacterales bacterium]